MEQQRAETREQQRGGNVKTGQDRNQNGRAEHGEHMLEAQHEHTALAEGSGVINALFRNFVLTHDYLLSFRFLLML